MESVEKLTVSVVLVAAFALCGLRSTAAAHAPPQIFRATFYAEGQRVVLLTNRGFIFGDLMADEWRLMCNQALGVNSSERPDLAALPDGSLLVATSTGLKRTRDGGCTWLPEPRFGSTSVPAMAQHPSDPLSLYIGAFGSAESGVHVSRDAGATWRQLLAVEDDDFIEELLVAAPEILYVSGQVFGSADGLMHYVARSSDAGTSFERQEVDLLEGEADLMLLAANPRDPDLLLARALDDSTGIARMDRLLVTRDGGRTWSSSLAVETLVAAAFGSDGTTAWVASSQGLWRSTDGAASFSHVAGTSWISAAFEHDNALWASGYYADGVDGIGVSSDLGASFQPLMAFTDVTDPVRCGPQAATTAACALLWQDWQREILGERDGGASMPTAGGGATAVPDAGSSAGPDAGTGASGVSGGAPGRVRSRDGCSALGYAPFDASAALVPFGAALFGLRARRRCRMEHDDARPGTRVGARRTHV